MRKTDVIIFLSTALSYLFFGFHMAAFAQQTEPDTNSANVVSPATTEPSAAPESPSEPDPQFEKALPYLEQGEVTFNGKNYEAALAEFERAYKVLQGHPKQCETLKNIGLCHERLFRYNRALEYFNRYLSECGAAAKERDKIEQKLEVLRDLLGTLKVAVNISAEVWVDNVLIGKAPGNLLVAGGRHTVELRALGYESEQREISIPGGAVQQLSFTLNEISEYKGISPVFFGSAAGLTVIGAGIGTWFGVKALTEHNNAKDRNNKLNLNDTKDEIHTSKLMADIFFASAGVFALGAGILYLFTDWGGEQKSTTGQDKAIKVSIIPTGTERSAGIQLMGLF